MVTSAKLHKFLTYWKRTIRVSVQNFRNFSLLPFLVLTKCHFSLLSNDVLHMVTNLVEAIYYKLEDRGLDSR